MWHGFFPVINNQTYNFMRNLLYIIAVILVIGWLVGFFAYSAGSMIHALLVIAIIAVLFNVISGNRAT
jgi:threonine/homoserine/homoserine lactone efflux protein